MHKSNIAHLDIKPDNIVVGKNYEVKLIDFGHCKKPWAQSMSMY